MVAVCRSLLDMRISPDQRLAVHLTAIGVAGGGAMMVFPTHLEIGAALMILSVSASALIELLYHRPLLLDHLAGRFRPAPAKNPDPFIPLPDAAKRLYEATAQSRLGEYARRMSGGKPEDILDWMAYWIADHGVTIYGKRPPSDRYEAIPEARFHSGGVEGGGVRIVRDGLDTFEALAVRNAEFESRLIALKQH